jgi:hypothetical protein
MTNLRLESNWYAEIDFCPFCGRKLTIEKDLSGMEAKVCAGTFHFRIMPGEETVEI